MGCNLPAMNSNHVTVTRHKKNNVGLQGKTHGAYLRTGSMNGNVHNIILSKHACQFSVLSSLIISVCMGYVAMVTKKLRNIAADPTYGPAKIIVKWCGDSAYSVHHRHVLA